jgi:hypothetical protein
MSFERVYAARHLTASAEAGTPTDEQRRRTGEGGLAMVDLRTAPPPEPPPSPPPRRRSRGPFVLLLVLVVVGVATVAFLVITAAKDEPHGGLAIEDPPPTSSNETSIPTTTLDPEEATKAEIIEAYRQSREAFVAIASAPNGRVDDPRLSQYKKGTALAAAQLSIRKWRADGHVLKVTQLELNPRVVELGPDTAVVEDCTIDVSALVDQDTGEVIEPAGPPEPDLVAATYELFEGVWMQNGFKDLEGSCVPGDL